MESERMLSVIAWLDDWSHPPQRFDYTLNAPSQYTDMKNINIVKYGNLATVALSFKLWCSTYPSSINLAC